MATYSLTTGMGVILLSTEWNQSGEIPGSSIQYNEYCPTDPVTSVKCVTGCTNTAAAQILYYWLEKSDFTLQLQLTQADNYVSKNEGRTITIDATDSTASKNGYLSFAEVNQNLKTFTVGDASDIATLCFACGVVQEANYSSIETGTAWNKKLFQRSGMAGFTQVSSYSNPYFYKTHDTLSDELFEVLINELLAGRPVGTSYTGHALIFDGYDEATDKFHINFGWGGYENNWYTREEINKKQFYQFFFDIMPDYDGSPILVTDSAAYGVGTFLRGIEQLNGIFKADTLTIQTEVSDLELENTWSFEKDITINYLNAHITADSGVFYNTGNITVNGFSGTIKSKSSAAIYSKKDIKITEFSGSIDSDATAVRSEEDISITGFSGSIQSTGTSLYSSGALSLANVFADIIDASAENAFALYGKSIALQNFSGICIAAGTSYSAALQVTSDEVTMTVNDGRIFAGKYTSQENIDSLTEALSSFGKTGIENALVYNSAVSSASYAIQGNSADDMILAKNCSIIQGNLSLSNGNDTLSVLGTSYIYAPSIKSLEVLNIDSTSTVSGTFYGSAENCMTVNMTITAETPSTEMIRLQQYVSNFYHFLKDKTFNIDLRAASDGEYILVNASGLDNANYLQYLSAKIMTGSGGTATLKCGESQNGVTLKYSSGKLILALNGISSSQSEALLFDEEQLLSVSKTVSSRTISSAGTDSLRLANGGTASDITVGAGGDLSVSNKGKASDTIVKAYGFLMLNDGGSAVNTTVKADGVLNLGESSVHSGYLVIEENAIVHAEDSASINFTLAGFSESTYQGISDFSRITGTPLYSMTLSDAQTFGTYVLAQNASGFNTSVSVDGLSKGYTLNVGSTILDGDTKYALSKSSAGDLLLTVSSGIVDVDPPVIVLTGDNKTLLRETQLSASTESGVVIYYSTDQKSWKEYTREITVTSNGTWYFKATDKAGNTGYAQKTFSNIDGEAPDVPKKIAITTDLRNVLVSWETSADHGAAGLSGYTVSYRSASGAWTDTDVHTNAIAFENMELGKYELKICAYDTLGNRSEYSETQSFQLNGKYKRIVNSGNMEIGDSALFNGLAAMSSGLTESRGGAIYNTGSMSIGDSALFSGNKAAEAGGAVFNGGSMTLSEASFEGNQVVWLGQGGAIVNIGNMMLSGGTFTGNTASYGGAVENYGKMTLSDVSFENNSAISGGAILHESGDIIFDTASFSGNSARYEGGAIYNKGSMAWDSAIFRENSATSCGGAVYTWGGGDISNTEFHENYAQYGGALYIRCSGMVLSGNIFDGNSAGYGGAVHINNTPYGSVTLSDNSFTGNTALLGGGGAVYNADGRTVVISGCTFNANSGGNGGAVYNWLDMIIQDADFTGNKATTSHGGAIYNIDDMTVSEAVFSNNLASVGGAVHNHGSMTLYDVSFCGNSATEKGGAVDNGSSMVFESAVFSENYAGGSGGAIHNTGGMMFESAIFSENSAYDNGGAVFNSGSMMISSASFDNNTVNQWGGAIYQCGGSMTLSSASFSGNSAADGGGAICNSGGSMTFGSAFFNQNMTVNLFRNGGAIDNRNGSVSFESASFDTNTASYNGGAICNSGGTMSFGNASFCDNTAGYEGGAIRNAGGSMTFGSASFSSNTALRGGAVVNLSGGMVFSGASFSGNTASSDGGAIYNWNGSMTLENVFFNGNAVSGTYPYGGTGGAVSNHGTMILTSAVFCDNAADRGGAIYNWNGSITIADTSFLTVSDTIYNIATMTFIGNISLAGNLSTNTAITASGANMVLDISSYTEANTKEIISDLSKISGAKSWSVTVGADQQNGTYLLAKGAGSFTGSLTVRTADHTIGTLSSGCILVYQNHTYVLSKNDSVLSLIVADAVPITVTADSASKTYDGNPLTKNSFVWSGSLSTGDKIVSEITGSVTDAGSADNIVSDCRIMRGNTDVTANYIFADSVSGTLEVAKRNVTLLSADGTKVYDGTPLENHNLSVSGDGFVKGEGYTADFTGSQLDAGSSDNSFSYTLNEGTREDNYDITVQTGTLEVTQAGPITVTAAGLSKKYDGTPLNAEGWTWTGKIAEGDQLVVSVSGSITDAGTSSSTVTGCRVMRGDTDVTANYRFNAPADGTLEVTKRDVTLQSADASRIYDGTPLANHNVTASGDGFVSGEGYTVVVTGSQTKAGSSDNLFTYEMKDGTKADNYNITVQPGTLTVLKTPVPISLEGTADSIRWDGTADGYLVQYSTDAFAHVLAVETEGTGLDAFGLPEGTYQWRVQNDDGTDFSAGESVTAEKAETPREYKSEENGFNDLFFVRAAGTWGMYYAASNVGSLNDWNGTNETAVLAGKNILSDVYWGSDDANILVMTDDANGDALFVDDIFSAFPSEQKQSRIAMIDEIRAGAGNDIVDMTSRQFGYAGTALVVRGGAGDDVIWANKCENKLFGDGGNDRLVGASGNDVIAGGTGSDSMHGGGGNDIFCFCENWGEDTVEQLSDGKVTLWFASGSEDNWDQGTMTYSDGTNSVRVSGGTEVVLRFGSGYDEYETLASLGAFSGNSSEKIFEDKDSKGIVASL